MANPLLPPKSRGQPVSDPVTTTQPVSQGGKHHQPPPPPGTPNPTPASGIMPDMGTQAVVLHSGGQDSTTCLVWAIDKYGPDHVHPLIVDYGQRHAVELEQARLIVDQLLPGRKAREVQLAVLRDLGAAALTSDTIEINTDATGTGNQYAADHQLPSTFVPGRNLLFLTVAAAYGATLGAYDLITGVCAADEAGYPDCRPQFIADASLAITTALDERVTIHTPLLYLTKADTFKLANDLGVLDLILEETHTCYRGNRSNRHPWGYGCGTCGSCQERAAGWTTFTNKN